MNRGVLAQAINRARAQPLAAVLVIEKQLPWPRPSLTMKQEIKRIASMLTKMAMKFSGVSESQAEYNAIDDYEHEHRCAEHEHEGKPEQRH